jgi:uncharacterized protein
MSSTLHAASVGIYLQILPQVARLIDKAEAHCAERGLPAEALTDARLAPDMWNFAMQVQCSVQHSAGAVQALRSGKTGPDMRTPPTDFAALRAMVADGLDVLQTVEPGEIDAAAGRDTLFEYGTGRMEFIGEDYLLSFALPNFMFHSSTAYAVLRSQGVAIGKRDFLGRTRARR